MAIDGAMIAAGDIKKGPGDVNVVEAIDQWIDARIDDFSDDELDDVLLVLDVIAAHELAEFNTYHLRDDEFDQLVNEFVDADQRLLADEMITGGLAVTDRVRRPHRSSAPLLPPTNEPDETDAAGTAGDTDTAHEPDETDAAGTAGDTDTADELDETDAAGKTDGTDTANETDEPDGIAEEELGAGTADQLAPRFLGSDDIVSTPKRSSNPTRVVVALTLAVAVGAFALGAWSLVNSLEVEAPEFDQDIAEVTAADPVATSELERTTPTAEADDTTEASQDNASESTDAAADNAAPEPDAAPEPEVVPEPEVQLESSLVAFVLDDEGAVHGAFDSAAPGERAAIYEPAEGASAAVTLLPWGNQLAFITKSGDVRVTTDIASSTSTLIWDTNNFEPAIDAALVADTNVLLTAGGSVVSFTGNESPNVDEPVVLWNESSATSLATNGDALLVVLEAGHVLYWRSLQGQPQRVWAAEGEPRATVAELTETAAFIGLDGGIVQRHQLSPFDTQGERAWQGSASEEPWALSFSADDNRTAVVLDSYKVVVIDEDDAISVAWDGSDGLPAPIDAVLRDDELVILLDTGSVVRVSPADPTNAESIWDVSEAGVSPARQPALIAVDW